MSIPLETAKKSDCSDFFALRLSRRLGLCLAPALLGLFGSGLLGGCCLGECYLVGEACEDIVGDVEPEALFEEEGEAHGLVGTGAVETIGGIAADVDEPYIVGGLAREGFLC